MSAFQFGPGPADTNSAARSLRRRQRWQSIYDSILHTHMVHVYGHYAMPCVSCKQAPADMVRCRECDGPSRACLIRFCHTCYLQYHRYANQHHRPEKFLEGRWTYVSLAATTLEGKQSTTCTASSDNAPFPVTIQRSLPSICSTGCSARLNNYECKVFHIDPGHTGSFFMLNYMSCPCHIPQTLVALGVMPMTPIRPSFAVTIHTMHSLFHVRAYPIIMFLSFLLT